MNDLEKAVAILVCMKHTYPNTFRAHELDKVLQHLIDHSQAQADVLTPFIETMTPEQRMQFAAANPMMPGGTSAPFVLPAVKIPKE